ncbi:hypothetical protein LTR08_002951 [Meristemomyces frigidus]|nr:hypothetical protein LTR08_002951 [Meristemomyces frigidus]
MDRVNVAFNGDIVLTVNNVLELMVSSVVLCLSSPVFKVMLGPHFAEGHAILSNQATTPKNIPLPEDDPAAMKLICLLLHNQNKSVPKYLHGAELLQFATTVDKYDCASAVEFASAVYMQSVVLSPHSNDYFTRHPVLVLQAAYLLDDADSFARLTSFYNKEDMRARDAMSVFEAPELLTKINDALEDSEQAAYKILSQTIEALISEASQYLADKYLHYTDCPLTLSPTERQDIDLADDWRCNGLRMMALLYLERAASTGLWPQQSRRVKLHAFLADIQMFEVPKTCVEGCATCLRAWKEVEMDFGIYLDRLKVQAKHIFAGVCLDCLKSGGKFAGECRFDHLK